MEKSILDIMNKQVNNIKVIHDISKAQFSALTNGNNLLLDEKIVNYIMKILISENKINEEDREAVINLEKSDDGFEKYTKVYQLIAIKIFNYCEYIPIIYSNIKMMHDDANLYIENRVNDLFSNLDVDLKSECNSDLGIGFMFNKKQIFENLDSYYKSSENYNISPYFEDSVEKTSIMLYSILQGIHEDFENLKS